MKRTQDTIYGKNTIDVPSAYIENAWMYKHMIALAQDAWCLILMVDQSRTDEVYSHGFAKAFRCPVIGVVSKSDLAREKQKGVHEAAGNDRRGQTIFRYQRNTRGRD